MGINISFDVHFVGNVCWKQPFINSCFKLHFPSQDYSPWLFLSQDYSPWLSISGLFPLVISISGLFPLVISTSKFNPSILYLKVIFLTYFYVKISCSSISLSRSFPLLILISRWISFSISPSRVISLVEVLYFDDFPSLNQPTHICL